jgi:hypothetical protein
MCPADKTFHSDRIDWWGLWNDKFNWNADTKTQVQFGAPGVANGILLKSTSRQQGAKVKAVKYW